MMCMSVGARNVNRAHFQEYSEKDPTFDDMTYEGLFNEYYYKYEKTEETELIGADISTAITLNPETKKQEYFVNVGLMSQYDGPGIQKYGRPDVKFCFVLDVSGSMRSGFGRDYQPKIEIAKQVVIRLLRLVHPEDYISIVLFDDKGHLLLPMTQVKAINQQDFIAQVQNIKAENGTNFENGYRMAYDVMLQQTEKNDGYLNRVLYLTDACPNDGVITPDSLLGMMTSAAEKKIYSTFFGIGIDFNTSLVDKITKCKGSSYYSIHNQKDFHQMIAQDFDYIVFPIAFDIYISTTGEVIKTYGSPETDIDSKLGFAYFSSFDASNSDERGTKGGVMLLQMKEPRDDLSLNIQFKDREGKDMLVVEKINFLKDEPYYQNNVVRKTIVLKNHITMLRDIFSKDKNKEIQDEIKVKREEQQQEPSEKLLKRIKQLEAYTEFLTNEKVEVKDVALQKEVETVKKIIVKLQAKAEQMQRQISEDKLEEQSSAQNIMPNQKYFM